MEIFDVATFGPNIIARANHLAAVERWNAPHVRGRFCHIIHATAV